MEPARSVYPQQTQSFLPQTQELTFEEISKLDLTQIEHSDQNDTPNTPRPSYLYDIFQSQIINNLEGLRNYLKSSRIHKEIRLNGCEITSAIADHIFLAILSNDSFTTLTFKNGKIDSAVFNILRNIIHNRTHTINNFIFTDIELSCESLALLINGLQKHPDSKLCFQNCRLTETDDLTKFYELLHMVESESDPFKDINRAARGWLEQNDPFFYEERHPISIELNNFTANPEILLAIQEELLKCNLKSLHIEGSNPYHRKFDDSNLSFLKPNAKFLQKAEKENKALSTEIQEKSNFLVNERSNKVIKYYNVKLSALELIAIIRGIQKHDNYRLRLENCKIFFKDENDIENFIHQLSVMNSKNVNPLVLELIKVKTNLPKGFPSLIKGLLGCHISFLHCQNCNMNSAAAELKNSLLSHKCTLDTLQIVQDQFEAPLFEEIAKGVLQKNDHPHPLSTCIFDTCQLNLANSSAIENLAANATHLSLLGFPNNQLGSKILAFGRRRNSSGSVKPFIREASGDLKSSSPVKARPPMFPIDSLARGLELRLANPNAEYLYLDLSFNDLTGKNINTIVNTIKKFLPKVIERIPEEENIDNPNEELHQEATDNTSSSEESSEQKPNIFINLCGNNAQEKLEQTLKDLLSIKKSSPRSIAIPHTRPTDNAADIRKSQELNINYIASTPREPTTPRTTIISPRLSTSSPRRYAGHKEMGSTG